MNDIEIEQLVGKSEEQIIQAAFKELRSKITPQEKRLTEILTKLEQNSPVNVTPSPYARYIKGWSTGMVKKGIGSVCAAALVVGVWYGFNSYYGAAPVSESETSGSSEYAYAITDDLQKFDFEHEDYFGESDADEQRALVSIMESDTESINSFNSLYDDQL